MNTKNRYKWILNVLLAAGFLFTYLLDFTGLVFHQWLGLAVGAVALLHLVNHWAWVKAITARFFDTANNRSRLYYVLDAVVGAGMLLIVFSGVLISTWLGVMGTAFDILRTLHILISIVTLAALILKLVLHWKCIATETRKWVSKAPVVSSGIPVAQCAGAVSRRDALKVIGAVSLAGGVAMVKALSSLRAADDLVLAATLPQELPAPAVTTKPSAQSAAMPTQAAPTALPTQIANQQVANCVVRCSRSCSYPGSCRRYTDANKNGRCDLGECL